MAGTLTAKQQRFVEEYLVDFNATQAAIRAGYSAKTANVQGAQNLAKLSIAAEIEARRAVLSEKLEISQEWVLQELAAIAKANAVDYLAVETERDQRMGVHPITGEITLLPVGWSQYIKVVDTSDLPAIRRAAVAGIKQGRNGIEIKLHDKVRALELLGKHLGLFENGAAATKAPENNLFNAIVGSAGEDVSTDDIPEFEQEAATGDDVVAATDV